MYKTTYIRYLILNFQKSTMFIIICDKITQK
jgi:hypothetical protein